MIMLFFIILSSLTFGATAESGSPRATELDRVNTQCVRRYVNLKGNSETETYYCPDYSDKPDQIFCCDDSTVRCCIASKERKFYEQHKMYIIIASIIVLIAVVGITVSVIVCCCWERCPLYGTLPMCCRAEAKPDYIAKPEDSAAISLMPGDNVENVKTYSVGKAASEFERRC